MFGGAGGAAAAGDAATAAGMSRLLHFSMSCSALGIHAACQLRVIKFFSCNRPNQWIKGHAYFVHAALCLTCSCVLALMPRMYHTCCYCTFICWIYS